VRGIFKGGGEAMKKMALLAVILLSSPVLAGEETACREATHLVQQAYDMGSSSYPKQKELLNRAIRLCPNHPEAHNNLGVILETEKDYEAALVHYQKAVSIRPDYPEAWFGIGEVYYKTGKLVLSLEAYLKGCNDPDARKKAKELLDSRRYLISEPGEIANAENLSLLFDRERREKIDELRKACGFKAVVEHEYIFRNIRFDTGSASLKPESMRQIQELASALGSIGKSEIIIGGHTDRQPFKGHSQEDSDRMNMRLSEDRAAAVAKELTALGISATQIQTKGYGPTKPMIKGDTPEAYAQNRRVAVEVR
jgi:outer membrane protein OmpA-like peptidoglycan-associated protein